MADDNDRPDLLVLRLTGSLDTYGFYGVRQLPSGRWIAVEPQTFGRARLCLIGPGPTLATALEDHFGYLDTWDYPSRAAALAALEAWSGTGTPAGWTRHLATGRRRQRDGSLRVRETDLGVRSAIDHVLIRRLREAVARGVAHECDEWIGERSGCCVLCDREA